jgi:Uma2 family endonuclease
MVVDRVHSKKYPHSIVLRDASWQFYRAMLREFDEQPSRINYDRGTLEVMTPLAFEHEHCKSILGSMVSLLAMALKMPIKHGGSATLNRRSKCKGLQPDQCYWVANEPAMRMKKRINLRTDPPPDLVLEIDVMHAVVNREKIYAALGVPEMWVLRRREQAGLAHLNSISAPGGRLSTASHFPFFVSPT